MFGLSLDQAISLVQLGIGTTQAIVAAVKAGKAQVQAADGTVLTAEDVGAHLDAALAAAGQAGTDAAGRIEDRHAGDGTGQP